MHTQHNTFTYTPNHIIYMLFGKKIYWNPYTFDSCYNTCYMGIMFGVPDFWVLSEIQNAILLYY